ncbi:NmrA family NAD(P)-binding protein [Allonocardiopsis opalescens]|nr:NmrA family NAD(P)-binding protein [Allonocardiopsis opalescens]
MTQNRSDLPPFDDRPYLVLGGAGKTGGRIAERLRALGLPVRIASRSTEPPFDWAEPDTWAPAVRGVRAVYAAYHPDVAVPGAPEAVGAVARAAAEAGAERMVLLSGRGEEGAFHTERALRGSGIPWTVLRSAFFAQNFSEAFMLHAVRSGFLAFPAGEVAEPFVDAEDIADAAVAALTGDGHINQTYELTGPRALTFAEAVAEIAAASGHPVTYQAISPADFESGLLANGVPQDDAALLAGLFGAVLDGRNAFPVDGVRRALGREARDFSDYVKHTAATGVWSAGPQGDPEDR